MIDDFKQRLQIPNAFVKNISEKSSEIAILDGPSGSHWHVKVNRYGNNMYLEDGWEYFARDHSLSEGDFLLFTYGGNMNFRVQIFDASTLEQENHLVVPYHGTHSLAKAPVTSEKKNGAIEEARAFRLKHPAVKVVMKSSYMKNYSPFPLRFVRRHLTDWPDHVTLRVSGCTWRIGVLFYQKTAVLSTGWSAFVTGNNIRERDVCVYELIEKKDAVFKQIPEAFIKNISEKSSEMAILKSPSGSCWHVKLTRKTTGMFLEDGWGCFSRAHSLSVGKFLVFGYNGNMTFTVQIFDSSMLEEESAFTVINTQEEIKCKGSKRRRSSKAQRSNHTNSCQTSVEPCSLTPNAEHHREKSVLEQNKPHQPNRSKSVKGKNNYSMEKDRAVQAAKICKLEHPFFTVLMWPSFTHYAPIPPSFSRRYFSKGTGDITLALSDGRTLNAGYISYVTNICKLMRGWKNLVEELDIKKGDLCVFELMRSKNPLFKVHILRDA
ncbi:hypothetical protein FRX31_022426 [Thalictrum thalictroides]|uniref:TF-B3 domain-containing protein n=1 Tax=Thalictrum thalictroides TaxID=46969 RepID=A0A7J6VT77_THATH|nr:hypothetical protein FRX31_022426 [Thalictrum thalictroides]